MTANRARDTAPETRVRRLLHGRGRRFRVNYRPLDSDRRRSVDIVFTRQKVAVLIDGCFWHGCPEHFILPKTNVDYWTLKIDTNRRRDADTTGLLQAEGWTVLRFWEHEDPSMVADVIETHLPPRGERAATPR